jgi:hypothetical protein
MWIQSSTVWIGERELGYTPIPVHEWVDPARRAVTPLLRRGISERSGLVESRGKSCRGIVLHRWLLNRDAWDLVVRGQLGSFRKGRARM